MVEKRVLIKVVLPSPDSPASMMVNVAPRLATILYLKERKRGSVQWFQSARAVAASQLSPVALPFHALFPPPGWATVRLAVGKTAQVRVVLTVGSGG